MHANGIAISSQYNRIVGGAQTNGFFGTQNVERIHRALVGSVYQRTNGKAKIDKQSDEDLRAIMAELYDQRLDTAQLNGLVVERATEIVLNNLAAYLGYIADMQSQTPQNAVSRILARPQPTRSDRSTGSRPVF